MGKKGWQRGQSTVEFGISAVVLILILFGLIDLGRAMYFGVGLRSAAREGARQGTWFDWDNVNSVGVLSHLYDTDGCSGSCDPCKDATGGIKEAVDCSLKQSNLPTSVLQNPTTTCPSTSDGNGNHNPPYVSSAYSASAGRPLLYICYENTPGLDITAPPTDTSMKGKDVNVIVLMNFQFASGFLQGVLGSAIPMAANTHMLVGGW
jgi:hypothetical protein